MSPISTACLFVCCAAVLTALFSTLQAFRQFPSLSKYPPSGTQNRLEPISILKPLKGADQGLERNLETFFLLDYPQFEIIFSAADAADPALKIVEKLTQKHPHAPVRTVIGAKDVGPNPKVNNLVKSYAMARYDRILISDSNVRIQPDSLRKISEQLEEGVGIVTSIVRGDHPDGFAAQLEATYLNTFYARGMLLASSLGRACVIGKSMLFRKSVAERFGGIQNLAHYLAEDFMAGEAMQRLGLRTVIAHEPVSQWIGKYSIRDFWSRHLRWGRIRKSQAPLVFMLENFLSPLGSGSLLLLAMGVEKKLNFAMATPFMLYLLIFFLCDVMLMRVMHAKISLLTPLYWIIRECAGVPLWFHIAAGNTVHWRGKRLTVTKGGLLQTNAPA